ncbi:MAG: hypothetical protein ABIQ12_09975, partial [Opitutaceae bacterium]
MKTPHFETVANAARLLSRFGFVTSCLVVAVLSAPAVAQSGSSGKITGRVFNPATQQYVRN